MIPEYTVCKKFKSWEKIFNQVFWCFFSFLKKWKRHICMYIKFNFEYGSLSELETTQKNTLSLLKMLIPNQIILRYF
ncbi:hypothetical protein LEP1GSC036_1909 [Leptospira weilii str. 2006001853]|uniref:Uncharacterized protein n=2 Tax=Leptospira weilii TaxID=28184 RepID=A0A828YXC5_9LEPT|nr:hypothetical protein LEP1GSC036_1909 [Leptospira weilii str. 2006001853]